MSKREKDGISKGRGEVKEREKREGQVRIEVSKERDRRGV